MAQYTNKIISEALTFDDVLLVPAYSRVLPKEVDITIPAHTEYQAQHTHCISSHGYGHRGHPCHCHGT